MASAWVEWQRAIWKQTPGTPDYFIDGDEFYCVHDCRDLKEHEALNDNSELQPTPDRD